MKKRSSEMHQYELTDPVGASTTILSEDIHNYILCVVRIFMNQTLYTVESVSFCLNNWMK